MMTQALSVVVFCALLAPSGRAEAPAQTAELRSTVETFVHAFERLDWDAFRSHFADDITFWRDDQREPLVGRAAAEESFREVFGYGLVVFQFPRPAELARRTVILRRDAEGWKIVHFHASLMK